jgi:hypothetical protein
MRAIRATQAARATCEMPFGNKKQVPFAIACVTRKRRNPATRAGWMTRRRLGA